MVGRHGQDGEKRLGQSQAIEPVGLVGTLVWRSQRAKGGVDQQSQDGHCQEEERQVEKSPVPQEADVPTRSEIHQSAQSAYSYQ